MRQPHITGIFFSEKHSPKDEQNKMTIPLSNGYLIDFNLYGHRIFLIRNTIRKCFHMSYAHPYTLIWAFVEWHHGQDSQLAVDDDDYRDKAPYYKLNGSMWLETVFIMKANGVTAYLNGINRAQAVLWQNTSSLQPVTPILLHSVLIHGWVKACKAIPEQGLCCS